MQQQLSVAHTQRADVPVAEKTPALSRAACASDEAATAFHISACDVDSVSVVAAAYSLQHDPSLKSQSIDATPTCSKEDLPTLPLGSVKSSAVVGNSTQNNLIASAPSGAVRRVNRTFGLGSGVIVGTALVATAPCKANACPNGHAASSGHGHLPDSTRQPLASVLELGSLSRSSTSVLANTPELGSSAQMPLALAPSANGPSSPLLSLSSLGSLPGPIKNGVNPESSAGFDSMGELLRQQVPTSEPLIKNVGLEHDCMILHPHASALRPRHLARIGLGSWVPSASALKLYRTHMSSSL